MLVKKYKEPELNKYVDHMACKIRHLHKGNLCCVVFLVKIGIHPLPLHLHKLLCWVQLSAGVLRSPHPLAAPHLPQNLMPFPPSTARPSRPQPTQPTACRLNSPKERGHSSINHKRVWNTRGGASRDRMQVSRWGGNGAPGPSPPGGAEQKHRGSLRLHKVPSGYWLYMLPVGNNTSHWRRGAFPADKILQEQSTCSVRKKPREVYVPSKSSLASPAESGMPSQEDAGSGLQRGTQPARCRGFSPF